MIKRLLLAGAMAAATFASPTAAFAGPADQCNGVFEVDGCYYCSYRGSANGSSASLCDGGYNNYHWAYCQSWISGTCLEGSII